MKRAYGQYVYSPKDLFEFILKMSFAERIKFYIEKGYAANETDAIEQSAFLSLRLYMELETKTGNCLHWFFTGEGIHDWLQNCQTPLTNEQSEIIFSFSGDKKKIASRPFMFHFLGGGSPVYLCQFSSFPNLDENVNQIAMENLLQGRPVGQVSFEHDKMLMICCGLKDEHMCVVKTNEKNPLPPSPERNRRVSLVSSALAYIACFPDTIKEGIPNDLKNQNYFRKQTCKAIGMHESLIFRDGPSPHYRIGHFRFLQSKHFTHKRGQIIFIHGTFVKGKAKTVEGIDNTTETINIKTMEGYERP